MEVVIYTVKCEHNMTYGAMDSTSCICKTREIAEREAEKLNRNKGWGENYYIEEDELIIK